MTPRGFVDGPRRARLQEWAGAAVFASRAADLAIGPQAALSVASRVSVPGLRDLDTPRRVETLLCATQESLNRGRPDTLDFADCCPLTPAGGAVIAMLKLYRDSLGLVTRIHWPTVVPMVRVQLARWRRFGLFPRQRYAPAVTAIHTPSDVSSRRALDPHRQQRAFHSWKQARLR